MQDAALSGSIITPTIKDMLMASTQPTGVKSSPNIGSTA